MANLLISRSSPYLLSMACVGKKLVKGKTMLRKIPHQSGIYQIKCLSNGKIYIGSAVDIHERYEHHRSSLRHGSHKNAHLQAAWDKYREEDFEFTVLELAGPVDLLRIEQKWLDQTQSFNREIGFNIYSSAYSPGDANAQVWEGFTDPDGNEVMIRNLYNFCRQNNLDFPSMHRLAKGESKLKSYKGWSHKSSPRQRDYIKTYDGFIDPSGNPAGSITNLAAFCRENSLDKTHMVAVAQGKLYSHRGWIYQNDRERLDIKTYTGFINPNGERVIITNLQAFCRENNLNVIHMRNLISGKRKSHKGWTWNENE